jgi:hypothetical protein
MYPAASTPSSDAIRTRRWGQEKPLSVGRGRERRWRAGLATRRAEVRGARVGARTERGLRAGFGAALSFAARLGLASRFGFGARLGFAGCLGFAVRLGFAACLGFVPAFELGRGGVAVADRFAAARVRPAGVEAAERAIQGYFAARGARPLG